MGRRDEVRLHVATSALTNFVKLRKLGKHYSFSAYPSFVPGIDGIGALDDDRRVYFLFPQSPLGGMAERTVEAASQCWVDGPLRHRMCHTAGAETSSMETVRHEH